MQFPGQSSSSSTQQNRSDSETVARFQNPLQVLFLFLNYWWFIAIFTALGLGVAVLIVAKSTPIYRATARVEIFQDSRLRSKATSYDRLERFANRHIVLMQSRFLHKDLREDLSEKWKNKVELDQLKTSYTFNIVKQSRGSMIDISVDSSSGDYAHDYLVGILTSYKEKRDEEAREINDFALKGLREEEQRVLKEWEDAKVELDKFEQDNQIIVSREREEMDSAIVNQLLGRLKTIRMERTILESQYEEILNADLATIREALDISRSTGSLRLVTPSGSKSKENSLESDSTTWLTPEAAIAAESGDTNAIIEWEQQEEQIANLEQLYNEKIKIFKPTHPDMRELRNDIDNRRASLEKKAELALKRFQARFNALKMQEKSIENLVDNWQKEESLSAERENKYLQLNTKVKNLQRKYDKVYSRLLATTTDTNDMLSLRTIHEPEILPYPISPNKPQILVFGFALGAMLGAGLIFLREIIQPEALTPEFVETQYNIPCLAAIPDWRSVLDVKDFNPEKDQFVVQRGKNSLATETYRALRSRIDSIFPLEEQFSIALTSPKRSDGKTFNSCNLAIPYVWNGKRVLLMDGDFRRARLTHMLLGKRVEEGWTHWLDNPQADIHSLIVPVQDTGVDLLSAGNFDDSIPEKVNTGRIKSLLKSLHQHYDIIIVDTAPTTLVVETNEICRAVNGVVFMADEKTSKFEVRNGLRELKSMNVIGFCLNNTHPKKKGYGYGYGYGYYEPKTAS